MLSPGRRASVGFWGGPGTGKTSIARLLADAAGLRFKSISAVTTNVSELKSVFAEAKMLAESGKRTALFIDEIHRMTKQIQDLLLAPIETRVIVLIGATTEHPAYELNNAIQSRSSVSSEEHSSEPQSPIGLSHAASCLQTNTRPHTPST